MVRLGQPQKVKLAIRYPHMLPEDILLWQRFIENGDYLPDHVWYDVRCGTAVEVADAGPEWMHRMADRLTRKRIDVVGQVGPSYWVIEIKPRASYDAFGQVVFYADQFQKEYTPSVEVIPVLLTDLVDPDILPLCDEVGVLVFEVGMSERLKSGPSG